jgi:hypothetical protein
MSQVFPSLALQYEPFLFAVVCDEANGMQLTLVSAIARTGVDPWREAARIASMPRERAREVLTALIPRRAGLGGEAVDSPAIVDRLMALLPGRTPLAGGENIMAPIVESLAAVRPGLYVAPKTAVTLVVLGLSVMMAFYFASRPDRDIDMRGAPQSSSKVDQTGR